MKYVCQVCGYVYDEAAEGVPFDQLPEDWKCPWCKAPKTQFKPEQPEAPAEEAAGAGEAGDSIEEAGDLKKLSPGQLAALCTNLARGCEKQYKQEESQLFAELAAYFTTAVPPAEDASVEGLAKQLTEEIASYPSTRAAADGAGDRGAARALVWGEKVSRMLSSLVSRYLEEGEAMLEGTEIWICTVCGFIYIGDTPPELCPVCKVPSWKFEKIEGR
ncbi:MAG: rubredoxin [Stomatobaculum sp.]|nr:rubredoxin [Stomatobaculum sp.]